MRILISLVLAGLFAAPQEPVDQPSANGGRALIDRLVKAKLQDLELAPAGPSDSAEFLRRVSLDITGTIPTLEQVEKFLKDPASDKRARLVEELLASEKYADHMATIWSGLLVGNGEGQTQAARMAVQKTMKDHFAKNTPFDEFTRAVITAEGDLPDPRGMARGMMEDDDMPDGVNGLVAFFVSTQRTSQREMPQALAGKFSRVFLGTQIQCAQCHDHPYDKWTQEDFYGMAAFFTQVSVRRQQMMDPKDGKDKDGKDKDGKDAKKREDYSFEVKDMPNRRPRAQGLVIPESKNKTPIPPAFLAGGGKPQPNESLRTAFARLLTSNHQFSRAVVNRTWGRLMGRGFVNPVDNFDAKSAPTHPDLLSGLAEDFAQNGHDMKRLIREIVMSDAYQRTSRAGKKPRDSELEKYYAVAAVRALTPEQIMASIFTAATVPGDPRPTFRPRELIGVFRDFRYAFGDDEAAEMVEFQGTIPAALLMMNSPAVQRATMATARGAGGRLAHIVATYKSPRDQVTAMVAATLSRAPTSSELNRFVPVVAKGATGAEDVYWTLLNSSEFLFNK
jgi:hypothetical protein